MAKINPMALFGGLQYLGVIAALSAQITEDLKDDGGNPSAPSLAEVPRGTRQCPHDTLGSAVNS